MAVKVTYRPLQFMQPMQLMQPKPLQRTCWTRERTGNCEHGCTHAAKLLVHLCISPAFAAASGFKYLLCEYLILKVKDIHAVLIISVWLFLYVLIDSLAGNLVRVLN